MENLEPHKREEFWYNINVLRERDDLIFDIGLLAGRSRRKLIHSVCEASGLVRSRIGHSNVQLPPLGQARGPFRAINA